MREAIREGVQSGTVEIEPMENPEDIPFVKSEPNDEVVNQVWLDTKSDNYDSESNSSYEPPQRASTSKAARRTDDRIIDKNLTEMLLSSWTPVELVDNPAFKKFVSSLNPNYQLPRSRDLKEKMINIIRKNY